MGLDGHQISKMILAEAFTYAFWGCVIGCMIGLPLSKILYDFLIINHFPYAVWNLPIGALAMIVLFVIAAAVLAAYSPRSVCHSIPHRDQSCEILRLFVKNIPTVPGHGRLPP